MNPKLLPIAVLGLLAGCDTAPVPPPAVPADEASLIPLATVEELRGWTTPDSRWITNRRWQAMDVLGRINARLLIVPVEGGRNAFDPTERYLITQLIANYAASADGSSILDPYWVARYFGFHQSSYMTADTLILARSSLANEIATLHAEHDNNGRFSLTVTVREMPDLNELRAKTWTGLKFDDNAPPSVAVRQIIDEVAAVVTGERYVSPQAAPVDDFDPAQVVFPASIEALKTESQKSPLHEAAYLQLIAALHPSMLSNGTRNELFTRSLVSLQAVSPESPYRRYFTARAYAYLDRRPAAIAALGQPQTAHDRALLALLNGDLPALREATSAPGNSAIDFMALKDLLHLEKSYGKRLERDSDERFVDANPVWAPFIYRALRDTSDWGNYSALTVKVGLENLLPAETQSVQGTYDQAMITGESPDELQLTRTLFKHVESFDREQLRAWSANSSNNVGISEPDIIDLATELAVANHLRRNDDDLATRKLPEAAMRRIREFESIFSGHPEVTIQLGRALEAMAEDTSGAEKQNLLENAEEAYRNGFSWTAQLTQEAAQIAGSYRRYYRAYLPKRRQFSAERLAANEQPLRYSEWPQGSAWFRLMSKWQVADGLIDRCIDYTWTLFSCVTLKIRAGGEDPDWADADQQALLDKTAHRFIGNPQRSAFEVKLSRQSGSKDAEVELLQARIEAGATEWGLYYALGREYKRRGEYQAAQRAWLAYPGFADEAGPIGIRDSNNANIAASMLYWIGQHELALPLLELAASSTSGSDANMSSGARLALIEGDFEVAAQWTAARIGRYQSKYAIRDMQQILHLLGESELAWGLFDQALTVEQVPQAWNGALVGHRMQNASIDDIVAWIGQSELRKTAQAEDPDARMRIGLAQRYLLMAGTMDRVPGPDFVNRVASAIVGDRPVYRLGTTGVQDRSREKFESTHHVRDNRRAVIHDPLVVPTDYDPKLEPDQPVESRYAMLAGAMSAFLNEDYPTACRQFEATAYLYFLNEYLPYYAFCAAETGGAGHFPAMLAAREPALEAIYAEETLESSKLGYRFDEDLTYAVLAAYEGRHDAALSYLRAALNNRPYIDERSVYPYYEVVDLAERLWRRFDKEAYRDFALDLSQRHTVVLPMYAWAYFVVATHSRSEAQRIEAIASGLYLDPQSGRLQKLPANLVEKARKMLAEGGPPLLRRFEAGSQLGT